jgi:hypothetical protein
VRLDHLLSKEHLTASLSGLVGRAITPASVRWWLLICVEYWLDAPGRMATACLVQLPFGEVGTDAGVMRGGCSAHCWVLREHALCVGGVAFGSRTIRDTRPFALVWVGGVRGDGGGLVFENCTVDASIFVVQVSKGIRWMSWHQEPMKDVGSCDKLRGAANRAVIRGFPNGETQHQLCGVTRT